MKISHIICISKILTDLYTIRQNIKIRNIFVNIVCDALVIKNSCKNIKNGSIKFKNHFKELTVPFKIYADF